MSDGKKLRKCQVGRWFDSTLMCLDLLLQGSLCSFTDIFDDLIFLLFGLTLSYNCNAIRSAQLFPYKWRNSGKKQDSDDCKQFEEIAIFKKGKKKLDDKNINRLVEIVWVLLLRPDGGFSFVVLEIPQQKKEKETRQFLYSLIFLAPFE